MVKPTVTIQTSANLANGYQVVNRADAGGQYMSQWETGRAAWITLIVKLNQPISPKPAIDMMDRGGILCAVPIP